MPKRTAYPYGLLIFFFTILLLLPLELEEANQTGTTSLNITPKASKTTQYPSPVHAKEPICCPRAQSEAPSVNCKKETERGALRPMRERSSGRGKGSWIGGGDDALSVRELLTRFQGEIGVGVGCVCNSVSEPLLLLLGELLESPPSTVGSRNEKKLCDRECLWWCPRLEVVDDDDDEVVRGAAVRSALPGGREPKVNP